MQPKPAFQAYPYCSRLQLGVCVLPQPPTATRFQALAGLHLSTDAVPASPACEPVACLETQLRCCCLASLPHPLLWAATHFTEMENSPGELSLSRIRKAPRKFRFIRISSASCREILPEYHLQREGQANAVGRQGCLLCAQVLNMADAQDGPETWEI